MRSNQFSLPNLPKYTSKEHIVHREMKKSTPNKMKRTKYLNRECWKFPLNYILLQLKIFVGGTKSSTQSAVSLEVLDVAVTF